MVCLAGLWCSLVAAVISVPMVLSFDLWCSMICFGCLTVFIVFAADTYLCNDVLVFL